MGSVENCVTDDSENDQVWDKAVQANFATDREVNPKISIPNNITYLLHQNNFILHGFLHIKVTNFHYSHSFLVLVLVDTCRH